MYTITEFSSWDDLKKAFAFRPLWGFRGQTNHRWPLETNLYRQARLNQNEDLCLLSREKWVLYQFRRFAHHYQDAFGALETPLDWLSVIQHYGGPTRLLDFTYSLYVAAFFATENTDTDSAIWAINTPTIEAAMYEHLNFSTKGAIHEIRQAHNDKFNELFENPTDACTLIPVEPARMHERMWTQQGFFVCPTQPNLSFMNNFARAVGISAQKIKRAAPQPWTDELDHGSWSELGEEGCLALIKIRLPFDQHEDIKNDLETMNINAATLFPGLEGFARSLRQRV